MLFAAILPVFARLSVLAATPTCYYSDKSTIADDDRPCNTSATTSPCWLDTDFCLDNGLCLSYFNLIYESSCTDRQWGPGCQAFCSGTEGPNVLSICGPTWDATAALLSCGWDSDCSDNFTVPYANGIVLRADQAAAAGPSKPALLYLDPSLAELHSTHTSVPAPSATSAHPADTHGPLATSNTSSSITSHEAKSFTAKDMAAVGAGVGIHLAIALAVAVALLYKEKRSKTYSTQPPSAPTIDPLPWQIQSPTSPDDFGHPFKPEEAHQTMSAASGRQELDAGTAQKRADGPSFTIEA